MRRADSSCSVLTGLRQVVRSSGVEAFLAVALHRLRGQGDDRQPAVAPAFLTDRAHRLVAVHLRHHDVHQNDRHVVLRFERGDRLVTGPRRENLHPASLQNAALNAKMFRMSSSTTRTVFPTRSSSERLSRSSIFCFSGKIGEHAVQEQRGLVEQPLGRFDPLTTTLRASV